jgi:DNA-binding HxlR family transcriptional regulator
VTIQIDCSNSRLRSDPASLSELVEILGLLSGKWVPALLASLCAGPLRHFQLRQAARGISPKALSDSLRRLVRDGLVTRVIVDDGFGAAGLGYSITPFGREVVELLAVIDDWTADHYSELVTQRASSTGELEVS